MRAWHGSCTDVVGGAVVAAEPDDAALLADCANTTGVIGAPFDAFQTLRGLRTLAVRIERQSRTFWLRAPGAVTGRYDRREPSSNTDC